MWQDEVSEEGGTERLVCPPTKPWPVCCAGRASYAPRRCPHGEWEPSTRRVASETVTCDWCAHRLLGPKLNLSSCTSTAHTQFLMSMMFYKTVHLYYGAPQTSLIVLGVYWRGLINAACGSQDMANTDRRW